MPCDLPLFPPASFFEISVHILHIDACKQPHPLPSTDFLLPEESFASFGAAWSKTGLFFHVATHHKKEDTEEDSVEIFIDTRDLKTHSMTRFCHHFFFSPEQKEGKEITSHAFPHDREKVSAHLLLIEAIVDRGNYEMKIKIPKEALFGYDSTLGKIGLSYRINTSKGRSQHFTPSSDFFPIETTPFLWPTIYLKGET